jgi:ABC-type lipoprotein export system ATPase subunit
VTLLSIDGVSKSYRRGRRHYVALADVTLRIDPGEIVVVLGTRKSGRSTLMRVAAGLDNPDHGTVRFDGLDLSVSRHLVGRDLCFCHTAFSAMEGERVIDHVAAGQLAQGVSAAGAKATAERALARVEAEACAALKPDELDGAESVRVAIARGLTATPRMLVIDDPTACVGSLERDGVLRLLASIAVDDDVTVLMSTDDATCVSGADRVVRLDRGVLEGELQPHKADVVSLSAAGRQAGAWTG